MTKLYKEIKDEPWDDALNILNRVRHIDLQREYWELAEMMGAYEKDMLNNNPGPDDVITDDVEVDGTVFHSNSGAGSIYTSVTDKERELTYKPAEETKQRTCITKNCTNTVEGRAKKCGECRASK